MKVIMGVHEIFDETRSVAATNNSSGVFFLANSCSGNSGSGSVGWVFGVTLQSVPDNSFSFFYKIGDFSSRNWTDIQFLSFGIFVEIFGDVDFVAS